MSKQEFLSVLRQSLSGEVPEQEVLSNLRYYEEYLTENAGKTTEQKIEELGEPRLLAKTIIDAYNANQGGNSYKTQYYKQGYDESYGEEGTQEHRTSQHMIKYYSWDTMKWYQKLIAIIITVVIAAGLIGIISLGINIFFSLVLPILLILFFVRMIMRLFR